MEKEKIINILKKDDRGLTITELVQISKLSRSRIRILVAFLEGAEKISMKKVGMAKVYFLKQRGKK